MTTHVAAHDDQPRPVVMRLPRPLADDLETVAWVERVPQAEVVRAALTAYLARWSDVPR